MITLYWVCLITGVLFALVTLVLGELLGHVLGAAFHGGADAHPLPVLQPVSLVSGITAFGACGLLLSHYTAWVPLADLALSLLIAAAFTLAIAFLYVRTMQRSENSTGFSEKELVGAIGEITVPVPAGGGCGEIVLKVGAARTNQIAASFDGTAVPEGCKAVVVDVRQGVLYVSPFGDELND